MTNQTLVNYIWTYLQQGYDAQTIRSTLLQQGYNAKMVDNAFNVVYKSSYHKNVNTTSNFGKKHFHMSLTELIAIIIVLLGIVIGGIVIASMISDDRVATYTQPTQITSNSNTGQNNPSATDPIFIDNKPITKPNANNNNNNLIQDTSSNGNDSSLGINNNNNNLDNNNQNAQINDQTEPYELSRLEIEEQVSALSSENPNKAITYCPQISTRNGENSCYAKIAIDSENEEYCALVSVEKQEDFCYMQFAIQGKGSDAICAKIKNDYRRNSCLELLHLNQRLENSETNEDDFDSESVDIEYERTDTSLSDPNVASASTSNSITVLNANNTNSSITVV